MRLLPVDDQDLLLPVRLANCLHGEGSSDYGFRHFLSIDSTNLEARRDAERGAKEFTVYVAEEQTSGRGREGRRWYSPAGRGIYCSLLFRPSFEPAENLVFTRISALAIHAALSATAGRGAEGRESNLRIKSPNDLLLNDRKVCGILVESASIKNVTQFVVAGFGINVNQDYFPEEIADLATSLRLECGRSFDRAQLLADVLRNLRQWYGAIQQLGFDEVDACWHSLTGTAA